MTNLTQRQIEQKERAAVNAKSFANAHANDELALSCIPKDILNMLSGHQKMNLIVAMNRFANERQ